MSKPKILMVEKDEEVVRAFKSGLSKVCDIYETGSLDDAINKVEEVKPSLILLDVDLADSIDNATLIKVQERLPEIPYIVISKVIDAHTAILHGAHDFISKGDKLSFRACWSKIAHAIVRHKVRPLYQPVFEALRTSQTILDELMNLAKEPDSWKRDK